MIIAAAVVVGIISACIVADLVIAFPGRGIGRLVGLHAEGEFDAIGTTARLRSRGIAVYPFAPDAVPRSALGDLSNSRLTVLSGVASTLTVLCNESGMPLLITSDKYGFSNPDSVWSAQVVDIALIGDSFTHGQCVGPRADIASHLRAKNIVINAGVSGSGPIAQLAVLREYVAAHRPRNVVWLFYEGNDMEDLAREEHQSVAAYLAPQYTQNLAARRQLVDSTLRRVLDSLTVTQPVRPLTPGTMDVLLLRHLRGVLRLPFKSLPATPRSDFALLDRTFELAQASMAEWKPRFFLVYLPERRRFDPGAPPVFGEDHDVKAVRQGVKKMADRLGIRMIDMTYAFAVRRHPLELWTGIRSHYSADAYRLIADSIAAATSQ